VASRKASALRSPTGRRIVRVCSDGQRGWQEIADALGTTAGAIQYSLTALLREGALHSDATPAADAAVKPGRGDLFWADAEQLEAAERVAREGHDEGQILEGDLVVLVRGADVAMLHSAMRPVLTAVATRWALRLLGEDALWLLAVGPDRDRLMVDQLIGAVRDAGGTAQSFSAEKLLSGAGLRAYLDAAVNPPPRSPA
jgi:hypothetical protein